jgi:hypothetical protein
MQGSAGHASRLGKAGHGKAKRQGRARKGAYAVDGKAMRLGRAG